MIDENPPPGAGHEVAGQSEKPEAPSVLGALEGLPDEALQAVADRAQRILEERAKERRAAARREIQRLAKEHGLDVELREPKRRRGRPPKAREGEP
jgi:hypothetical protein